MYKTRGTRAVLSTRNGNSSDGEEESNSVSAERAANNKRKGSGGKLGSIAEKRQNTTKNVAKEKVNEKTKHVSVNIVSSDDHHTSMPVLPDATKSNKLNVARATTPLDEYVQMRMDHGGTTTLENEKRVVQRYVRETLFSKVKFITNNIDLEYTGTSLLLLPVYLLPRKKQC